jgi:hypothetical protein
LRGVQTAIRARVGLSNRASACSLCGVVRWLLTSLDADSWLRQKGRGGTRQRLFLLAIALFLGACTQQPSSEARLVAALIPGITLGDTIPSTVPGFGTFSFSVCDDDAHGSYSADASDSTTVISRAVFAVDQGHHGGSPPALLTSAFLVATTGRSNAMRALVAPLATRIYASAPDTGCLRDGPSRVRQVLYWRSHTGTTVLTFPSDSVRELHYQQAAFLTVAPRSADALMDVRQHC